MRILALEIGGIGNTVAIVPFHHGPDTPERLEGFSLDALIADVKSLAPDLLSPTGLQFKGIHNCAHSCR